MDSLLRDAIRAPEPHAPQTLLERFGPESSFFFASPTQTLLARGTRALLRASNAVQPGEYGSLAERTTALLKSLDASGQEPPIVVGAVPFDETSPSHLSVPVAYQRSGPMRIVADPSRRTPLVAARSLRMSPEPRDYVRGVEQALALMRTDGLRKVVLSRMLELHLTSPVDLQRLLRRLAQQNPSGYTFAVDLSSAHSGARESERADALRRQHTLVGASPELLVSRAGLEVVANPLAGSVPRSLDSAEDRRRAEALRGSEKDHREHAIVVEAVESALRPLCRSLRVPPQPSLLATQTMWHLSSRITGELADLSISSLALATALHPTPAICGVPVQRARAAIKDIEPFDRGFFTGMVGFCDAAGDGEWAVVIRCADITDEVLRLYSGAGIVPGSDAERELRETSAKMQTMLNALGLDRASEVV